MPNRILKESICTSETIDELSAEEECFFYRLLVNCDDYGLMDGRETVLRSRLYSLRVDSVTNAVIRERLLKLQQVGLVELYEVDGHPYLHVTSWESHQQVRAQRAKYPRPDQGKSVAVNPSQAVEVCNQLKSDDSNGNHPHSHVPVIQSNPIQTESESKENHAAQKAPRSRTSPKTQKTSGDRAFPGFQEMWGAFVEEVGAQPLTAAEIGKWGNGIKQLLKASRTPGEIPMLVSRYGARFPSLPCNPMTIANNLSYLLEEQSAKSNGHGNRAVDKSAVKGSAKEMADQFRAKQAAEMGAG